MHQGKACYFLPLLLFHYAHFVTLIGVPVQILIDRSLGIEFFLVLSYLLEIQEADCGLSLLC